MQSPALIFLLPTSPMHINQLTMFLLQMMIPDRIVRLITGEDLNPFNRARYASLSSIHMNLLRLPNVSLLMHSDPLFSAFLIPISDFLPPCYTFSSCSFVQERRSKSKVFFSDVREGKRGACIIIQVVCERERERERERAVDITIHGIYPAPSPLLLLLFAVQE